MKLSNLIWIKRECYSNEILQPVGLVHLHKSPKLVHLNPVRRVSLTVEKLLSKVPI